MALRAAGAAECGGAAVPVWLPPGCAGRGHGRGGVGGRDWKGLDWGQAELRGLEVDRGGA